MSYTYICISILVTYILVTYVHQTTQHIKTLLICHFIKLVTRMLLNKFLFENSFLQFCIITGTDGPDFTDNLAIIIL